MLKRSLTTLGMIGASVVPAFAHLDPQEHGSFLAGLSHPLSGLDHILAMVAVGLWAVLLAGRSVWKIPLAFVAAMIAGYLAAMTGMNLPFLEPVITGSVIAIGLLALAAFQAPPIACMMIVGFFAFFHGSAHGGELGDAGAAWFMVGFAIATALLHASGIGLGLLSSKIATRSTGQSLTRIAGGLTALCGILIFVGT